MQRLPARYALVPLRIIIGFGFASHGYAKLARGPDQFASLLSALGVPLPGLAAWTTTLLELFGGIAMIAGALVVPLSVALAVIMAVAMFSVHLRYGFSSIRLQAVSSSGATFGPVGYEINLLYICGLLTLGLAREHALSVDHWARTRRGKQPALSA